MQKKMIVLLTASLMAASVASAGGSAAKPPVKAVAKCMSIADIVASTPNFSTLLTALQAANLVDTLKSGQYTVFAPTNASFNNVPSDQLAGVLNDEASLKSLLLYHVVPGKFDAKQVMSLKSVKSVQGGNLSISTSGSKVLVNGINVVQANIPACNGVIHVIDGVLMPPVTAVAPPPPAPEPAPAPAPEPAPAPAPAPEPAPAPAPAPAPEPAPAPAPAAPLVIASTPLSQPSGTVNDNVVAQVPAPTPAPAPPAPAPAPTPAPEPTAPCDVAGASTVYDLVVADDRFSTLRSLLSDAGLTETLMSGEYTVFAPTDEAFAKVDPATLALIASDPALLKQVLLYHVVPGNLTTTEIAGMTELTTAEGQPLAITAKGVGDATVTTADVAACNGTIHIIDGVLLPPDLTLPAPASTTTSNTTTTDTPPAPTVTEDATATAVPPTTTPPVVTPPTTPPVVTPPTTPPVVTPPTTPPVVTPPTTPPVVTPPTTPPVVTPPTTPPVVTPPTTPPVVTPPTTPPVVTPPTTPPVVTPPTPTGTLATLGNNTSNFNITQLVATDPQFSTLASLLNQTGLTATLMNGVYTVFAPTNAAFAKLDKATLDALAADPEKLKQVLLYHVADGYNNTSVVAAAGEVPSLDTNADPLSVTQNGDAYTVNGTNISQPDVQASNGVIQVIDSVLMPPSTN